jgi:hypothetical protein
MKSALTFLFIALVVSIASSSRADTDELHKLNDFLPAYQPRFPVDLSWIIGHYEFDWIGNIDEYYGTYYRYWERYLTDKQRKFAGKFGLSNIFFKPDFRDYENTKVVFSKSIQNDRLLLRYLAPVGDMGDFNLSLAVKPHQRVTFVAQGHMNGEKSIAMVIQKPLGSDSESIYADRRARKLFQRAKRLLKH